MASFRPNIVFFVVLKSLIILSLGFNIQRSEDILKENNTFSNLVEDLFKLLHTKNLLVMPIIVPDISDFVKSEIQSSNQINQVLDQYPDKFNKTFSKVEQKDGKTIVTNTTIIKDNTNHSISEMYIEEKTVNGKDAYLRAQLHLPSPLLS